MSDASSEFVLPPFSSITYAAPLSETPERLTPAAAEDIADALAFAPLSGPQARPQRRQAHVGDRRQASRGAPGAVGLREETADRLRSAAVMRADDAAMAPMSPGGSPVGKPTPRLPPATVEPTVTRRGPADRPGSNHRGCRLRRSLAGRRFDAQLDCAFGGQGVRAGRSCYATRRNRAPPWRRAT